MGYDFFLSYDEADGAYAKKLYEALKRQKKVVWYDKVEVYAGDDIRQMTAAGMAKSSCGVVILSPNSLTYWPETQLTTLFSMEARSGIKILPVLLRIDVDDLKEQNPLLSLRQAVSADEDIDDVARELCAAIDRRVQRPELSHGRKVFLSYAIQDEARARVIKQVLETQNIEVFAHSVSIKPGIPRDGEIGRALRESGAMFVFWSTHAAQNKDIRREYQQYLEQRPGALCVPLQLDDTALPVDLDARQGVDVLSLFERAQNDMLSLKEAGVDQQVVNKKVSAHIQEANIDPRLRKFLISTTKAAGVFSLGYFAQGGWIKSLFERILAMPGLLGQLVMQLGAIVLAVAPM